METFFVGLAAYCIVSAVATPALSAYAVDISPEATRGSCLSMHRMAGDLVWCIGPVGLGILADMTSPGAAVGVAHIAHGAQFAVQRALVQPEPDAAAMAGIGIQILGL